MCISHLPRVLDVWSIAYSLIWLLLYLVSSTNYEASQWLHYSVASLFTIVHDVSCPLTTGNSYSTNWLYWSLGLTFQSYIFINVACITSCHKVWAPLYKFSRGIICFSFSKENKVLQMPLSVHYKQKITEFKIQTTRVLIIYLPTICTDF